ncbi:PPOX class F420-dependent oxidoreductase [Kitasatospora sp. MAP5-34]|uniref:PPOX class F420-dependent oxidoreductase n=1 Tax=Kitasatospora sp. MAP5-34 TaxID=3035102 RepID=UPI0024748E00|nr:PPOX class F420-dependent oxidoreductase [Kitasatospora sp. MAP5-34]MDH6576693.1 PPOX class probable F420-dependent enzyme [Kitasatospora sp. MAP5-34]
MAAQLSDAAKALLDAKTFAVVTTLQPDGSPQSSVVWVARDGDDVLFCTVEGRRKHLNMVKDPRVSVLVNPPDNPYSYFEVRGEVAMTTEGGRELINALSQKYRGEEVYGFDGPDDVRVVVRLTPRKVVGSI